MLTRDIWLSPGLAIVWLLPAAAIVVAHLAVHRRAAGLRRRVRFIAGTVLLLYVFGALILTLFPWTLDVSASRLETGNWTPGGGTLGFLRSDNEVQVFLGRRDFFANVLLFAPLGVLFPLVAQMRGSVVMFLVLLGGMALGLELLQGAAVPRRTFDIDDAIAGLVGAVAGIVVGALINAATRPPILRASPLPGP